MSTAFEAHLPFGDHASRPAAGDVPAGTLYACSTHTKVYQSDGSSTWSDWFDPTALVGGGGNPVVYDIERYTGGTITVSSTSAGAAMAGIGTVTVAAASGDLVMLGISARDASSNTSGKRIDIASIVSAAAVNYVSSLTGTPASTGISGLFGSPSEEYIYYGEMPYVVQAGDISGGNVEFGLRAWLSGAQNWTMEAQAAAPFLFWVRNLGQ